MEQLEGMIFQFHAMSYNQNITQITLVIYAAAYQSPEQLFPSTRHTAHSIPYQVSQYQHPYLWTMPLSDHLPQSDGQEAIRTASSKGILAFFTMVRTSTSIVAKLPANAE